MMNTTKVQESYRKHLWKKWEDDDSLNMLPIYWQSIREIQAEDPGASAEFLTALGALDSGSVYSSNVGTAKRSRSLTSSRGSSRRKVEMINNKKNSMSGF
jgi:hypothetical protein